MAKAIKKVDYKKAEKTKIMEICMKALAEAGYEPVDGIDYGFTSGTIVAKGEKCDIQIKPISPKAGVDRYEALEEEDEEVEEKVEEKPVKKEEPKVEETHHENEADNVAEKTSPQNSRK